MSPQQNPFVNPNQRGVELPPGFKDLMDVIKSQPIAEGPIGRAQFGMLKSKNLAPHTTPQIELGKMSEIEPRLAKFLKDKKSTGLFSVTNPLRRIFLPVACHDGKLTLSVFVTGDQTAFKEALRRVFRDEKLCRSEREPEVVTLPLPGSAKKIARMLKELLVKGFGVSKDEPLLFHEHRKKE